MNGIRILKQVFIFGIYMLLQGFLFRHFVFFDIAMCFVYLIFLLQLPNETPKTLMLIIGFAVGLMIDSFYDTAGIQAASCVLIMYLRHILIKLLAPSGGYESVGNISIKEMGFNWYLVYTTSLVFIHHFCMFLIEAGGTGFFLWTLLKIILSTIFTTFMIMAFSFIFHGKSR